MNPQPLFCPNATCPARGVPNRGHIRCHSQKEQRYRCTVCRKTFRLTQGTLYHGLRTAEQTVTLVVTLLAHGCPLQAVVHAFGLDERTVRAWWQRAGAHCEALHAQQVLSRPLDLGHIQADEIRVKTQGGRVWMALLLMVSTRLWLGGVLSPQRDLALVRALLAPLRTLARCRPLLVCVDGLASYVRAVQETFVAKLPRYGRSGRSVQVPWPDIVIGQVVKQRTAQGLTIVRRIVQGTSEQAQALLAASKGGSQINTAYIERLNATLRQRLAPLARRSRSLVRRVEPLQAGMWVVGCLYNFCTPHRSLRRKLLISRRRNRESYRWVERTPAMAAGLTDHIWTPAALFAWRRVPPRWTPPKKQGRPSNETRRIVQQWCS
jgi:transposase-like protein